MFERKFLFNHFDGLAGFNGSRTGETADQLSACLLAVLQVRVGLRKYFVFHDDTIAKSG
ncbi:hypothetical protein MNBD_GAMMA13-1651 [hydrothermal vent metagenome]|uniref:Uncharacterized protein n=1 Tax=hydrothermal vent metagenome TaxID=652676 RepID=A0A3B0ZD92_9ZZZZ